MVGSWFQTHVKLNKWLLKSLKKKKKDCVAGLYLPNILKNSCHTLPNARVILWLTLTWEWIRARMVFKACTNLHGSASPSLQSRSRAWCFRNSVLVAGSGEVQRPVGKGETRVARILAGALRGLNTAALVFSLSLGIPRPQAATVKY